MPPPRVSITKMLFSWTLMALVSLLPFHAEAGKGSIQSPANTLTPICQIQGKGYSSSYKGQIVYIQGVVTADFDQKRALFTVQQPDCDGDPKTSDAIWVYIGTKAEVVSVGDGVEIHGTVDEYYGRTEIVTTYDQIFRLSSQNPLPEAQELAPPREPSDSNYYFETREAMRVQYSAATVIGATDSYQDTWVVPSSFGVSRLFHDDPQGTGGVLAIDERGTYKIQPPLKGGDLLSAVKGVLDESYDAYRIYLTEEPVIFESPAQTLPKAAPLPNPYAFRLTTFNLANLYDTNDDPAINDTVLSNAEYQRRLQKRALVIHDVLGEPEIIVIQEAENSNVLYDLVHRPEITTSYEIVWRETPDPRGLDVALLFRTDRFSLISVEQEQGCTTLIDGLGPDGNQNVSSPENAITCDTDQDGIPDGNRLFSRPPLIVTLEPLQNRATSSAAPLTIIVNHWKSKVEDTPWELYTLSRRTEEAVYTAGMVNRLRINAPQNFLLLAGDLNDFPSSPPLQQLQQTGLVNLTLSSEASQRYSYVYRGISQNVDYLYYEPGETWLPWKIEALHINADYPYSVWSGTSDSPIRSSDHDLWQGIFVPVSRIYLPFLAR